MAADLHTVATDRHLAPDPAPVGGPIDEQPAALRIAAHRQPGLFVGQRPDRRQKRIGDAVPAITNGPQAAVRRQPIGDSCELLGEPPEPGGQVVIGQPHEGAGEGPLVAQASEVVGRGRVVGYGHAMGAQKLRGPIRRVEMIVWRLTSRRPSPVVGPRAVVRVGQAQGRIDAERYCNGLHDGLEVTLPRL